MPLTLIKGIKLGRKNSLEWQDSGSIADSNATWFKSYLDVVGFDRDYLQAKVTIFMLHDSGVNTRTRLSVKSLN
jgi:hypothetical protein